MYSVKWELSYKEDIEDLELSEIPILTTYCSGIQAVLDGCTLQDLQANYLISEKLSSKVWWGYYSEYLRYVYRGSLEELIWSVYQVINGLPASKKLWEDTVASVGGLSIDDDSLIMVLEKLDDIGLI